MINESIPKNYVRACDLIEGDLIVYENAVFQVLVLRKCRLAGPKGPSVLPKFKLFQIDDGGYTEIMPPCVDSMFRLHRGSERP